MGRSLQTSVQRKLCCWELLWHLVLTGTVGPPQHYQAVVEVAWMQSVTIQTRLHRCRRWKIQNHCKTMFLKSQQLHQPLGKRIKAMKTRKQLRWDSSTDHVIKTFEPAHGGAQGRIGKTFYLQTKALETQSKFVSRTKVSLKPCWGKKHKPKTFHSSRLTFGVSAEANKGIADLHQEGVGIFACSDRDFLCTNYNLIQDINGITNILKHTVVVD